MRRGIYSKHNDFAVRLYNIYIQRVFFQSPYKNLIKQKDFSFTSATVLNVSHFQMHFIDCIFPKYMLVSGSCSRIHSWNCDKSLSVTITMKEQQLLEKVYQQNQSKNTLGMSTLHWTPEILILSHSIVPCRESNLPLDLR